MKLKHAKVATLVASLITFGSLAGGANGATILQPTNVVFETGGDIFPISQIIDQSGMSVAYTSGITDSTGYVGTATSVSNSSGTIWASASGVTSGSVIFDLGSSQTINEFYIWTQDGATATPNAVELFTASSISDFAGGSSILAFNVAQNPGGTDSATIGQTFTFADTSTQFVRLRINNNYGSSILIIGEVAFGSSSVPEPSSALLLGLGALAITTRRRRK